MQDEVTLYAKGEYGVKVWKIWSEGSTIHILANGGRYTEEITEGKAGRSVGEQIALRIKARVRNKLASGFKNTREEAIASSNTNQIGLIRPMLATHAKDNKHFNIRTCYIQPKLDGHRCLINSDIAYSRGGKEIDTIPEIQAALNLPEGVTIDGELYSHGVPLQTVASWAKRRQEGTLRLGIHVYDIITEDDTPFSERFRMVQELIEETQYTHIVDTQKWEVGMSLDQMYALHRQKGYEGSILRPALGKYEAGKRSKTLLKVKKRFDGEFKCVDVLPSREGDLGILLLETQEGKQFKTIAPGCYAEKVSTLINKENFIGRRVTCEYAELSIEKIPQHCVAIRWRRDL